MQRRRRRRKREGGRGEKRGAGRPFGVGGGMQRWPRRSTTAIASLGTTTRIWVRRGTMPTRRGRTTPTTRMLIPTTSTTTRCRFGAHTRVSALSTELRLRPPGRRRTVVRTRRRRGTERWRSYRRPQRRQRRSGGGRGKRRFFRFFFPRRGKQRRRRRNPAGVHRLRCGTKVLFGNASTSPRFTVFFFTRFRPKRLALLSPFFFLFVFFCVFGVIPFPSVWKR